MPGRGAPGGAEQGAHLGRPRRRDPRRRGAPTRSISVQVVGVDTEAILEKARVYDNTGNRIRKIRELLFESLGVADHDEMFLAHSFVWRGSRRRCDLLYANVRELPDESLRAQGDDWKVVVDWPFDDPGHTPVEDHARVDGFLDRNDATRTLVWLPAFFSLRTQAELGKLVILDHLLRGDNLDQYAAAPLAPGPALGPADPGEPAERPGRHAPAGPERRLRDRPRAAAGDARRGPRGRRGPLPLARTRVHAPGARGGRPERGARAPARPGAGVPVPRPPALRARGRSGRTARRCWPRCRRPRGPRTAGSTVDKPLRPVIKLVANPLGLGHMGEQYFVPGEDLAEPLQQAARRREGDRRRRSAKLRGGWTCPKRKGLEPFVGNLLILAFAEQTNRAFYLERPAVPEPRRLDNLRDDMELRQQDLPDEDEWDAARRRAKEVFGLGDFDAGAAHGRERRGAGGEGPGAGRAASGSRLHDLAREVRLALARMGVPDAEIAQAPRWRTAQAADALVSGPGRQGRDGRR